MKKVLLILGLFFALAPHALAPHAYAVEPDEVLSDPALEARARAISQNLRCLVCQNENIDSSHAELAKDLRVVVRERLLAGDTDEEVYAFVVERYGDFVLLKPPFQSNTLVLWLAPALFMGLGALGVFFVLRSRAAAPVETALSAEEEERIKDLL